MQRKTTLWCPKVHVSLKPRFSQGKKMVQVRTAIGSKQEQIAFSSFHGTLSRLNLCVEGWRIDAVEKALTAKPDGRVQSWGLV